MPAHLPAPNKKEWRRYRPDQNTSDGVLFLLEHFAIIGYVLGAVVSGAVWMAVASTGFSVMRVNNHEWWGIFPVLLTMGVVGVAHECLHVVFANWKQSRFTVEPKHFAIAVQIGGEFNKARYVLCVLAPTIVISSLVVPAMQFDSPFLMLAVIVNLTGSGLDWITAAMAVFVLKGSRVFMDGENAYLPVVRKSRC